MRCLAKNIALFGLGLYIFRGEDLPQEPVITFTPEQKKEYIDLMAAGDGFALKKFGNDVGPEVMNKLFADAPKNVVTKQKDKCRVLVNAANQQIKATLGAIEEAVSNDSPELVAEALGELLPLEREFIDAGLDEVLKAKIESMGITV
jgi:hypothetical protein